MEATPSQLITAIKCIEGVPEQKLVVDALHNDLRKWFDRAVVQKDLEHVRETLPYVAFHTATNKIAESGTVEMLQLAIDDPRAGSWMHENFYYFCRVGNVEMVKLLLKTPSVNPNRDNISCLGHAAERGNVEIIRILLADDRVIPQRNNNWALKMAVGYNMADAVKVLLDDPRVAATVDWTFVNACKIQYGITPAVKIVEDFVIAKEQAAVGQVTVSDACIGSLCNETSDGAPPTDTPSVVPADTPSDVLADVPASADIPASADTPAIVPVVVNVTFELCGHLIVIDYNSRTYKVSRM